MSSQRHNRHQGVPRLVVVLLAALTMTGCASEAPMAAGLEPAARLPVLTSTPDLPPAPVPAPPPPVPAVIPGGPVPGVDYLDPLAVAAAYLRTRWSYDTRDPVGHAASLTAPGLVTPALAARSQPTPDRLAAAQAWPESSIVDVGPAALAPGAPVTDVTAYAQVPFTATVIHTGAPHGQPVAQTWQLRLTRDPDRGWLVDAVLATH